MNFRRYDTETLQRWYDCLNCWEWPDDLPNKPLFFDQMKAYISYNDPIENNRNTKHYWIGLVHDEIEKILDHKEILRWHHLHNLNSNNLMFEYWWWYTFIFEKWVGKFFLGRLGLDIVHKIYYWRIYFRYWKKDVCAYFFPIKNIEV